MNIRIGVRDLLRQCGHAITNTVHERLDAIERRLDQLEKSQPRWPSHIETPRSETQRIETRIEMTPARQSETDAALLQASIHIIENLHALAGRTVVEPGAAHETPEAAMAAFLYSHVPHRAAIQIHERSNMALADAGYEVYTADRHAFERLNGAGIMTAIAGAGASATTTEVQIRRTIPDAIGLATLGGDALARLRQTGDFGAWVIAADLERDFAELAAEMRRREYHWHLGLYRSPSRDGASYFANYPGGVRDAKGSVFFFRDFRVFSEAQAWCAATLPRTYFKPLQA